MKGSEVIFDYVQLLYYKCHKINPNLGVSYIDSPNCIRNKKTEISPINKKDNKCFQYAVSDALSHQEIEKDLQTIAKNKFFTQKYNWEGRNFPSEKYDWKKLRKIM